ncbi:cyclic nucleotide-binding domain-containing protein [Schlesneria sp. DSM 10557]|uniref:cyclic nucleotide-binding domain-containing protein n=1 Tax=Schlesneria sp. DSM 10557 TaxID=3044399 RepID=UPI0035A0CF52
MDSNIIAAPDIAAAASQIFSPTILREMGMLVFLIVAALIVLPRPQRRLAVHPIVFLVLAATLLGISSLFSHLQMDGFFRLLAEFLLLTAVVRTCFLCVITILQRAMKWSPQRIYLDICLVLIYGVVLVPLLSNAGLKSSDLITGTSVLTLVLGLALQGTLGNIFAGIAINVHHPFAVGDWIQFNDRRDHIGKVKEISWRGTTVVTLDSVEIVIPNTQLAEMPLANFMRPQRHTRRSVHFVCPYSIPPGRVHSTVLNAIAGSRGVLAEPAPTIITNAFTERGVEYWLRFFTDQFEIRDSVDGGVRDRVWYALQREGITMPPAVMNVQLQQLPTEETPVPTREEIHERVLRGASLSQGLPDKALAILARESKLRRYHANEVIIRQYEPGRELFIVHTGTVSVASARSGSAAVEITRLGPGDYFGEMSLLLGEARSGTVTAVTDCELLVIDKPALAAALAQSPEMTDTLSRTVAARQKELGDRLDVGTAPENLDERASSLLAKIQKYFGVS